MKFYLIDSSMASNLQNTQDELHRRNAAINSLDNYVSRYNIWLDESIKELGFTKERLQKVLIQSKIDKDELVVTSTLMMYGLFDRQM